MANIIIEPEYYNRPVDETVSTVRGFSNLLRSYGATTTYDPSWADTSIWYDEGLYSFPTNIYIDNGTPVSPSSRPGKTYYFIGLKLTRVTFDGRTRITIKAGESIPNNVVYEAYDIELLYGTNVEINVDDKYFWRYDSHQLQLQSLNLTNIDELRPGYPEDSRKLSKNTFYNILHDGVAYPILGFGEEKLEWKNDIKTYRVQDDTAFNHNLYYLFNELDYTSTKEDIVLTDESCTLDNLHFKTDNAVTLTEQPNRDIAIAIRYIPYYSEDNVYTTFSTLIPTFENQTDIPDKVIENFIKSTPNGQNGARLIGGTPGISVSNLSAPTDYTSSIELRTIPGSYLGGNTFKWNRTSVGRDYCSWLKLADPLNVATINLVTDPTIIVTDQSSSNKRYMPYNGISDAGYLWLKRDPDRKIEYHKLTIYCTTTINTNIPSINKTVDSAEVHKELVDITQYCTNQFYINQGWRFYLEVDFELHVHLKSATSATTGSAEIKFNEATLPTL